MTESSSQSIRGSLLAVGHARRMPARQLVRRQPPGPFRPQAEAIVQQVGFVVGLVKIAHSRPRDSTGPEIRIVRLRRKIKRYRLIV